MTEQGMASMKVAASVWPAALAFTVLAAAPVWATTYDFTQLPFRAGGLNDAGQVIGLSGASAANPYGSRPTLYDHGTLTLLGFGADAGFNNFYRVNGINDAGLVIGSTSTTHFSQPFAYQNGIRFDLGPAGTTDTSLNAVNNKGDIVGTLGFNAGPNAGFLLSNGVITGIVATGAPRFPGDRNGIPTNPTGINDLGQIVGTDVATNYFSTTGFLLSGGIYSPITVPGSLQTFPVAINDSGEVVGTYNDGTGVPQGVGGAHGFEEQGGVFTTITGPGGGDFLPVGLNNLGQIVGNTPNGPSFLGTPQAVPEPSTLALLGVALTSLIGWRARTRGSDARR